MEYGEDIKAAKIVIKMFLKARKNLRMYPANNPIYANTLEDTFEKFKTFFYFKQKFLKNNHAAILSSTDTRELSLDLRSSGQTKLKFSSVDAFAINRRTSEKAK